MALARPEPFRIGTHGERCSEIDASIRAADSSVHAAIEADVLEELERNPQLLKRWAFHLAVWLALGGRIRQAVPLLEQAIDMALQEQDLDRAFRLEAHLSSCARLSPAVTRSRLARYRDHIESDSPNGRLAATIDAGWCLVHGEAAQGVECARRALHEGKLFVEQPEPFAPGRAIVNLWAAGALDDAQVAAEQALTIARERGAAPEMAAAWWLRGNTVALRGDLAAAEADYRQALHLARLGRMHLAIPIFAGALAGVLIDRGAVPEAAVELERVDTTGEVLAWFSVPLFHSRLLLAQGQLRHAAEQLLALQRRLEDAGLDGMPFIQPRAWAARALAGLGDYAHARELAEAELVDAKRWGASWPIARACRALALSVGKVDGIALLREAVAALEASPAALERAHALSELGGALRRARRRAEARAPLREALELARRCGAVGLAKRTSDELEATGETVRRYVPIGIESLTASERRVAELAAGGMTNREIAQSLFLTTKTIETHLSAVYHKLDIHSRRLLPDALRATTSVDGSPIEHRR